MTLFRIPRMFATIRGFQQGLAIGNCMQFGWVWGCVCGFCPWHSVSAKLLAVVCGCYDCSGISSPEIYYTLLFDVWSTHQRQSTYSKLFFPFQTLFLFQVIPLISFLISLFLILRLNCTFFPTRKEVFPFMFFICNSKKTKCYEIVFSKNDLNWFWSR